MSKERNGRKECTQYGRLSPRHGLLPSAKALAADVERPWRSVREGRGERGSAVVKAIFERRWRKAGIGSSGTPPMPPQFNDAVDKNRVAAVGPMDVLRSEQCRHVRSETFSGDGRCARKRAWIRRDSTSNVRGGIRVATKGGADEHEERRFAIIHARFVRGCVRCLGPGLVPYRPPREPCEDLYSGRSREMEAGGIRSNNVPPGSDRHGFEIESRRGRHGRRSRRRTALGRYGHV